MAGCPKCGALEERISKNIATMVGECGNCRAVFYLVPSTRQAIGPVEFKFKRYHMYNAGRTLHVDYKRSRGAGIAIIVFTLYMLIMILSLMGRELLEDSFLQIYTAIVTSPFLLLLYFGFVVFCNTIHIVADAKGLSYWQGPLPWRRKRQFRWAEIDRLYVRKWRPYTSTNRSTVPYYFDLCLIKKKQRKELYLTWCNTVPELALQIERQLSETQLHTIRP